MCGLPQFTCCAVANRKCVGAADYVLSIFFHSSDQLTELIFKYHVYFIILFSLIVFKFYSTQRINHFYFLS